MGIRRHGDVLIRHRWPALPVPSRQRAAPQGARWGSQTMAGLVRSGPPSSVAWVVPAPVVETLLGEQRKKPEEQGSLPRRRRRCAYIGSGLLAWPGTSSGEVGRFGVPACPPADSEASFSWRPRPGRSACQRAHDEVGARQCPLARAGRRRSRRPAALLDLHVMGTAMGGHAACPRIDPGRSQAH